MQELRYWKKGLDGAPLTIDRDVAFDFIKRGVYGGEAPFETSRTLVQRIEAVRSAPSASASLLRPHR